MKMYFEDIDGSLVKWDEGKSSQPLLSRGRRSDSGVEQEDIGL